MVNPSILVVEDDRNLSNAVHRALKRAFKSATIVWVTTAEEAETKLSQQSFNVVLSDLTLCGTKTGIDLWRTCKANHQTTPFVMMSGMPVAQFLDRMKAETQPPPFLPKPFHVEELFQMLREYL